MSKINFPTGKALIAEYRRRFGDTTLLSFSRGKDSIGCALALRDHLDVVPLTFIDIPGLTFVEESLDYYERKLFGGRRIIRVPHPLMYDSLSAAMFQTYETANVLFAMDLPKLDFKASVLLAKKEAGITQDVLTAVGMRAADSALRQMSMRRHGPFRPNQMSWCPIWDWNKEKLLGEITKAKLSLPIDYLLFGRSFDGIDASYVVPLKRERPADYRRLCEYYPLLDVEVFRYEIHQKADGDRRPIRSPHKWTETLEGPSAKPHPALIQGRHDAGIARGPRRIVTRGKAQGDNERAGARTLRRLKAPR